MVTRHARWILLAAAIPSLAGCASVFKAVFSDHRGHALASTAKAAPSPATGAASAAPLTDAGRAYLAMGNTGLAIEAFQHALGAGEPAAPALNGLGVAYARIDRLETAQKLFAQAIDLAPDNQQYAANMARLLRSPALAMRHDGDIAAEYARAAALETAPTAAPAQGQLVRVSANEFQIATVQPGTAPLIGPSAGNQTATKQAGVTRNATSARRLTGAVFAAAFTGKPTMCATATPTTPTTVNNPFAPATSTAQAPTVKVELQTTASTHARTTADATTTSAKAEHGAATL